MASSITPSPSIEETSFPISLLGVNVNNFVSSKLWGDKRSNNYSSWKQQMLCLIESHDLLCFIIDSTRANAFRRTDTLLKGWILGALSDPVLDAVANSSCATARDFWAELEKNFSKFAGPANVSSESPDQVREARSSHIPNERTREEKKKLHKAALEGNWEAAKLIFGNEERGLNIFVNKVTRVLHVAVGTGERALNFVQELVAKMSNDELALQDDSGLTALFIAARAGNKAAAEILVKRMPDLLYIPNRLGSFPIHMAALYGQRDVLVYLMHETKDNVVPSPYNDLLGLRLLTYVIDAGFLDIALKLVNNYSSLATLKQHDYTAALERITAKMSVLKNLPQVRMTTRANEQALGLVKYLCKTMELDASNQALEICTHVILKAAKLGVHEVVEAIVETFPLAINTLTLVGQQYIFHIAVENRCEDVFNLIYRMSDRKHLFIDLQDSQGNNLLHLAGKLAPFNKLNEIPGAALQMQREFQWFKEVEKLVHPFSMDRMNKYGKTPKMLFTEEHRELKKDGEKWMKDTANSYIIVAILIATIMFAVAVTVPGGNESNTGFPIFSKEVAFTTFAVADAASVFTSITSLLMFLSILTSRYAEEDFLFALPKRLIIGLGTLFISITCMIISFAATVLLVFGQKRAWVLIPVAALACLPIASFVLLQFPLLCDVFSSTYRPRIFGKKTNRPFY